MIGITIDLSPELAATLGTALGFGFTLAIFSYLLGDNPLYRIALHIFIGATVGYATLITVHQVLIPRLVAPLTSGNIPVMIFASVPLVLFIFLALKLSPRLSAGGNITIAFMLSVGTAVAIAGALRATLLPQISATWLALNDSPVDNVIMVIGTLTTLLYFQFWVRARSAEGEPGAVRRAVLNTGRVFIVTTLGATYAGMIVTGISLASSPVALLWDFIAQFLG